MGDLPNLIEPGPPALQVDSLPSESPGKLRINKTKFPTVFRAFALAVPFPQLFAIVKSRSLLYTAAPTFSGKCLSSPDKFIMCLPFLVVNLTVSLQYFLVGTQ